MRFLALVSGGKDSIYSILECLRNGHELVACVHMARPESVEEESYMYQTAASEVVRTLVEDCLGVPLLFHQRVGTSINTTLVYDNTSESDEVEDLFLALKNAKDQFENIQAVCSGAILSTYQRVRIEHVCSRLGLTSLSYLWRLLPQKELLQRMLNDGIEAVVVRAACPPGLMPRKHLNKTLRFLWDTGLLERLHQRYQFHVCGEGGEYESLVIDSPLHKKKLVLDQVEIEETDDGVGDLRILKCHAEDKGEDDIPIFQPNITAPTEPAKSASTSAPKGVDSAPPTVVYMPNVFQGTGSILHMSEIMAPIAAISDPKESLSEVDLAVQEAKQVLAILQKSLDEHNATPQDVLFVHLYLSEISHFASINASYQAFFGVLLPPSRSCVAVGKSVLPGGRRVLLDCMVQPGSGEYMRTGSTPNSSSPYALAAHATKTSKLRDVLHVQSISHWAPVCVGPYSQVNTLRSGIHFLAGQIGLIPASMTLHSTWTEQLNQCWKNVACVLDALGGGSLNDIIGGTIYISHKVHAEEGSFGAIQSISKQQWKANASITAGRIDSLIDESELYGGYEDQGTWEEMKGEADDVEENFCPLLVVSIPEMPKGAATEIEVIAATATAAKALEIKDSEYTSKNKTPEKTLTGWDSGHIMERERSAFTKLQIKATVRQLGHQGAAIALVSASTDKEHHTIDMQTSGLLHSMILGLKESLADARSGFNSSEIVHIRVFYVATKCDRVGDVRAKDDGLMLRAALQGAILELFDTSKPSTIATSVVPVHFIGFVNDSLRPGDRRTILAIQALCMDPVHLETNIWINKDRQYSTSLDL